MKQQPEHLSDAQIEQFGARASVAGVADADRDDQLEMHLADCSTCRDRLLASQRSRFIGLSGSSVSTDPYAQPSGASPDCPEEDALRDLAAGLYPADQAVKLIQHAAQCDHCGPVVRMYAEDFSEDLNPTDQSIISKAKSSSSGWQKAMSKRPFTESVQHADRGIIFSWQWLTAPAALVACALIAFGVWYSQRETPEKVERLLAQAYSEQRTMEMRWPGAEWAPIRVTRGTQAASRFSKPVELLKAEEIIGHQSSNFKNVKWLTDKAAAELLDGPPDAAITTLTSARAAGVQSVPAMFYLSIADVEKAQDSHNRVYFAQAIDLLIQITRQDPQNKEALFNLAQVYSFAEMWDQAATAWEAYLRIDPRGPWAEEAKKKLVITREKLKVSGQQSTVRLTQPVAFLELPDREVEASSEEYQDIALEHWIEPAISDSQSQEYHAVSRLARLLWQRHSDPWLKDFLDSSNRDGARALSRAVKANRQGLYAEAIYRASQAEAFFHGNPPGVLRARYESVYAEQRFLHGKECLRKATPLAKTLAATGYHWLQSQVGMEKAICLNFVGDLSEVDTELASSSQVARDFNFRILALRNLGVAQGTEIQQGKFDSAWQAGLLGLGEYWKGTPSVQRIFQFYAGLARSAEHMELWFTAEELQSHAVTLLDNEDDLIQRGAARMELARIMVAERHDNDAVLELVEANRLLDLESNEPTSRSYRLAGKIRLAELQLKRGELSQARSTLLPAQELLSESDGYFVSLNYYRLSGSINLQLRQLQQAAEAFKSAIVIAEHSLSTLKKPQDRVEWVEGAQGSYRGLVRTLIEQHQEMEALRIWEWYKSRPERDDPQPYRPSHLNVASWIDVQKSLPAISLGETNTSRIIYAVFDDGLEIWLLTPGKFDAAWVLEKPKQNEQLARQFAQACARPDSPLEMIHQVGQKLFAALLSPVIRSLPSGSTVVIEADLFLSDLPFEALPSPDGRYFGTTFPIIRSPGVIREKRLHKAKPLDSSLSVLLADASYGAEGTTLPGSEAERRAIGRFFPRTKVVGSEQAYGSALHADLLHADIFAFIGHGARNDGGTALQLGPRFSLVADDFPPETLRRVRLVVLAACSTAPTSWEGTLETKSLVHSFLTGGVNSVVASSWDVDSEITAQLMIVFYNRLAEGQRPDLALLMARNEIQMTHDHPYFWAGFSLFGGGKQLNIAGKRTLVSF